MAILSSEGFPPFRRPLAPVLASPFPPADALSLARIFTGRPTRSGRLETKRRSSDAPVLPPRKAIPGPSTPLARKENSSRAAGRRLRGRRRLRLIAPDPNVGISTDFPFAVDGTAPTTPANPRKDPERAPIVPFSKLISGLGSANSRPIAVLVKPFSASALELLARTFATTTEIRTRGG